MASYGEVGINVGSVGRWTRFVLGIVMIAVAIVACQSPEERLAEHRARAAAYLEAGAHAIGFVNPLFDPEDVRAGRFDRIEERARRILKALG